MSLAWDDPTVAIEWPLADGELPQLSGGMRRDGVEDVPLFD